MKIKELAEELKNSLNEFLNNCVEDVVIFGSQVRGDAKPDSDYDVLIVIKCEDNRQVRRAINDICYDLELKYDIFLDTQIITSSELKNGIWGKHPLVEDAIREGVHAWSWYTGY